MEPERASKAPQFAVDVKNSSGDRVVFPDSGQTKGELADYYAAVAPLMLPFVEGRPASL